MLDNLATAMRFFRDLKIYNKNEEFKVLRREVFAAICGGATVSIIHDMPELLRVEGDKKLFEIEKWGNLVSAVVFRKRDSYPIEKTMEIVSFSIGERVPRNVMISNSTVKNRIYSASKRIQIVSTKKTAEYNVGGGLLHQKFDRETTTSADVSDEFLRGSCCTELNQIVTIDDLGFMLKYRRKEGND